MPGRIIALTVLMIFVSLDNRIFPAEFDGPINDRQPQRERYTAARQDGTYRYQVDWRCARLQPARRNAAGNAGCSERLRQESAD